VAFHADRSKRHSLIGRGAGAWFATAGEIIDAYQSELACIGGATGGAIPIAAEQRIVTRPLLNPCKIVW
jgi:hypothetical protein